MEAVFLAAVIDALEGQEVAVLDVPGAFMQVDIDELVHVRLTGEMVNMLLQIDSEMYKDDVMMEKRRTGHVHGGAQGSVRHIACCSFVLAKAMTEFRQTLQVQSHLEMPGILVQLGHIQRT